MVRVDALGVRVRGFAGASRVAVAIVWVAHGAYEIRGDGS